VTGWQQIALDHPCLLAEETAHPRFGHVVRSLGTVVLTINTGYE
jgi:hypothetical protein